MPAHRGKLWGGTGLRQLTRMSTRRTSQFGSPAVAVRSLSAASISSTVLMQPNMPPVTRRTFLQDSTLLVSSLAAVGKRAAVDPEPFPRSQCPRLIARSAVAGPIATTGFGSARRIGPIHCKTGDSPKVASSVFSQPWIATCNCSPAKARPPAGYAHDERPPGSRGRRTPGGRQGLGRLSDRHSWTVGRLSPCPDLRLGNRRRADQLGRAVPRPGGGCDRWADSTRRRSGPESASSGGRAQRRRLQTHSLCRLRSGHLASCWARSAASICRPSSCWATSGWWPTSANRSHTAPWSVVCGKAEADGRSAGIGSGLPTGNSPAASLRRMMSARMARSSSPTTRSRAAC